MSLVRLPTGHEGKLPSLADDSDENLPPIEMTLWKCRRQVIATLILSLGVLSLGTVFGWAVISISLLEKEGKIRFNEAVLSSIFIVGAVLSGPVAAYAMIRLGRKRAMLCHSSLLIIGWAVIPLASFVSDNNAAAASMLYLGRFITGFAGAGCFTIAPIYVGELCDHKIHSLMESIVQLHNVIGYLLAIATDTVCYMFRQLLGQFLDWFWLSIACCFIPPILTGLLFWIPESPQYLQGIGEEDHAKKALYWLTFGFPEEEQKRIYKNMRVGVDLLSSTHAMRMSARRRQQERKKLKLTSRPVIHPLIVSISLIFIQQLCGICAITSFTLDIFEKGGFDLIGPKISTILIAVDLVTFYIVATLLVERVPRKTLILTSALTIGAVLTALGVYFLFAYRVGWSESTIRYFGWVPLVCAAVICSVYSIGLGSMAWVVVAEINHPDWRETSGFLASSTYWLAAFISTLTFPSLRDAVSYHWTFWMYAIVCFAGSIFIYFGVYETHGKTELEIMAHYKGHWFDPEVDADLGGAESLGSIVARKRRTKNDNRYSSGSQNSGSLHSESSDSVVHTVFEDGDHHVPGFGGVKRNTQAGHII